MTQPLLSILVPTVVGREIGFEFLKNKISNKIIGTGCEVQWICDNKEMTIGEKREELYKRSNGFYSWMLDDDDDFQDNAIELILEAIKSNPEIPCITFREKCMMNGVYKTSNHSIRYSQWMDNQDGFDYVRSPFYKDVIRTDIAQSVQFEHIRYNEDERWAKAIYPLLTDEIHIDQELYHYIYNETNHEERYGLNRD